MYPISNVAHGIIFLFNFWPHFGTNFGRNFAMDPRYTILKTRTMDCQRGHIKIWCIGYVSQGKKFVAADFQLWIIVFKLVHHHAVVEMIMASRYGSVRCKNSMCSDCFKCS